MTEEKPRGSGLLLIAVAALLLLVPVAAVVLLYPVKTCPYCLGQGLEEEPPAQGRWMHEADLVLRVCECCGDRFKIGRFKRWQFGPTVSPQPPVYRRNSRQTYQEIRMQRLVKLTQEVIVSAEKLPLQEEVDRPDLVPILAGALRDEDSLIRKSAVNALVWLNRKDTLPLLLSEMERLDCDSAETLMRGLIQLTRFQSLHLRVVETLTSVCRPDSPSSRDTRFYAAAALLELKEPCNSDFFLGQVSSWSHKGRIAIRGLVQCDRKDAIMLMIKTMAGRPLGYQDDLSAGLRSLTGENLGNDPTAWYRWFEKNQDRFPPQIE